MDRDAGQSDRGDEARQGDTGMIGSEAEEPGPGRDTSLTDPDPVAASTDQPRDTVAMSEGDPMRTRLGSHVEGAGAIGYDVAAAEEGTTQQTPPDDRPGYEPERPLGQSTVTPAGLGATAAGDRVDDAGSTDRSVVSETPTLAGYEGEPGGAGLAGAPGDRPGGGGSLLGDEEDRLDRLDRLDRQDRLDRLDRPGPQSEPGVDQGVDDQEADRARRERPSEGR
jgi:hypothetical protein